MRLFFGGCLAFFLFVAGVAAQITGRVESIGFDNKYRPGCWTPMVVRLQSTGAPAGFYELRVWQHDLDGDLPYYASRVSITPGAGEQPFWTYFIPEPIHDGLTSDGTTPAEFASRLRVTVHDASGKELTQLPVPNSVPSSVDPLVGGYSHERPTRFVLFVGASATPPLGDYDPLRIVGIKENLTSARVTPDKLPESVLGYDGIDAVVWLGGDAAELSKGGSRRFDALRDFVRRGGSLVLSTPPAWQELAGFDEMMPVDITGTEQNALQSPAREVADRVTFPRDGGNGGGVRRNPWERYKSPMTVAVATPRPGAVVDRYSDRVAEPTKPEDSTPWLVRRPYGFGNVTWVAQDLGSRELIDHVNWGWPAVWEEVLGAASTPAVDPGPPDKQKWDANGQSDVGFAVLDAMNLSGRGAKLVAVTVLFFIGYWALVGPGAFFWLRYKGRATLNWFVFGVAALAATALTLGVVRVVLRGDPEIRHLSLVRVDGDRARPARVVSRIGMYVPRDGAQRIELPAKFDGAQSLAAPTLTPFPIHPSLHRQRKGDAYLFAAPRAYRIDVPAGDADAATVARADVPFRTTMKRMKAEWSGPIDDRIEGRATLTPPAQNVGYISGTLTNITGHDLRNVYVAFRHQLPGGQPTDWLMHLPRWKAGDRLDLAAAFNPPPNKSPIDITVGGERGLRPGGVEFPIRGRLVDWMDVFAPTMQASSLIDVAELNDLNAPAPMSIPILSFFDALPALPNSRTPDGRGYTKNRADVYRSGVREWDVSNALEAGRLVVVAQADDTALPLPLTVEGNTPKGRGQTIYQFVLPLDPIPEAPSTRPTK